MLEAFKAVRVADNWHVYTLGMDSAKSIRLPHRVWLSGGTHGISAAKTKAGAEQVARFALKRKVRARPKMVAVARVLGSGVMFENKWRVIFRRIKLVSLLGVIS